jgi:hypothetical protein
MLIYPILTWFKRFWPGSTVQFTAFFIFWKKKEQEKLAAGWWIFNPGDIQLYTVTRI